ncbi:MAG TPA: NHLP bacteriocin system secretion protein [Lachnospiraceae bacterium]|nr:NHLP bacteriocin system secretion protein [Lachnospiraceae bacterium]
MPDLFRKTSLEKLSSPEQLDRAIVITSPAFWIALGGGFVIVLGALLWAVFGRIPVNVESQGIYLNGEGIRSVYGEVDGIVTEIRVKEGDQVKAGDVVAVVGGGEITAQIEKLTQRIEDVQKVTLDSTSDVATADNKSLLDLKDEQIGLVDTYTQANKALNQKREELVGEQQKEQELKARMDSSKNSYYDALNNRENSSVELAYSRRQSELSNSQSDYSIAKQTADQVSDQLNQARLQYDAQKKTVETLENEMQSLTAKEEQYALAVAELETMRQQLEADSAALEELGTQCEAKEKEVQDLEAADAANPEIQASPEAADTTDPEIQASPEAADTANPEIQASLEAARQELQSLREQLSANTAALEELKGKYEAKAKETETMETEVRDGSAKKEELSLARQELQTLQHQLDSMTEQNNRAQRELADAKSKLDQAAGAFESANNDYVAELSRQSEVSSQREIAGNEYTQIVSDYAEQKSKVLSLEQSIESLEQEVDSAEDAMNAQTEKIRSSFDTTKASLLDELNRELEQQAENLKKYEILSTQDGTVQEVVSVQGAMVNAGSEIIKVKKNDGNQKEALCYMAIGNGKKVVPGMKVMIYPTTVNKQEYGHMTGTVESVAGYVTSAEEMKKRLGDDTLVQYFSSQGPVVEVVCSLEEDPNTASGYAWSSKKGKDVYLMDGTMLEASVIVERKAPITMVIPLLKSMLTESASPAEEEAR